MKNQSNDPSHFDDQLRKLDQDIHWKENRKNKLENDILYTISREQRKKSIFSRMKYPLSIGLMLLILGFGYLLFSDRMTEQSIPDDTDQQVVADQKEQEEIPETSENPETMEVLVGPTESISRKVEGMEQEVQVVHYEMESYGVSFQLDAIFEGPEVRDSQILYSYLEDYQITLEVVEQMNLEDAVESLQEKLETEGYDESFELEDTPLEENGLTGKMQFYVSPVKGFIAYELKEHVLVITFQYPEEGGDGMYPLLLDLRQSIEVR